MEGEKKKGILGKLKDAAEDQEHQIQILGTFVRLGVVVWSGFIITMNYVELPMIKKAGNSEITFVASVFTGALATFGLSTGKLNPVSEHSRWLTKHAFSKSKIVVFI